MNAPNKYFYLKDLVMAAGSSSLNEDRAGVTGNVAWLIDGATQLDSDATTPSASEGTWMAELLELELARICFPVYNGSLDDLFGDLAAAVRDRLAALSFPAERVPPVASLGVARLGEDRFDVALLGDVSALFRCAGDAERLHDARFLRNEHLGADEARLTALPEADRRKRILERRRMYVEGSAGPVVLSANPGAVRHSLCKSWRVRDGARLLLASDGFMRIWDVYDDTLSPREIMDLVDKQGLRLLLEDLRSRERGGIAAKEATALLKSSDDATAILVEVKG